MSRRTDTRILKKPLYGVIQRLTDSVAMSQFARGMVANLTLSSGRINVHVFDKDQPHFSCCPAPVGVAFFSRPIIRDSINYGAWQIQ